MPRGRPRKNAAPTGDGKTTTAADNEQKQPRVAKEPLTDEQLQALFFKHKREYEIALAAKQKADAELKVVCKRIKAESTKLSDVKLAIALESPEGNNDLRERLEREMRVARWMGAPIGTQFSLLDEDRTPIDDKTRDEGKRAGLRGEPCTAPSTLPGNLVTVWTEGWQEGQKVLMEKGIAQKPDDDEGDDPRPRFLREKDSNAEGPDSLPN